MLIDFNLPLKNLSNEPIKTENGEVQTIGKLLGSVLSNSNKGNALKFYGWATALWNDQPINVDRSDKKLLIEFIENCENLTVLGKAQILILIDNTNGE